MHDSNSISQQDSLQQGLVEYVGIITSERIPPAAVDAARLRIIDTLGATMGAFFDAGCRAARDLAAGMPQPGGATILGTRATTTADMAAFVNATTARCAEMTDTYHAEGSAGGHPSDTILPLLAVADHVHSSGRDFIAAVVLAYEIYLRLSDAFPNRDFDHTNFCCIGTALAAGKLLGLNAYQLGEAASIAAVPNVSLRQARTGNQTIWRAAATGQAGRAGVFAALLARAGLQGASMPFAGDAGWCKHVARTVIELPQVDFADLKIGHSRFKFRASAGNTMACVLAAERIAPLKDAAHVERITVETFKKAVEASGIGEHNVNPTSRESADHSIPYLVAATLLEGTVTPRSFGEAMLCNPRLRELMRKIEVVADPELTARAAREPRYGLARVHALMRNGERVTGDAAAAGRAEGGEREMVLDKFRNLTIDYLGAQRVEAILEGLLALEAMPDVASIPPAFVLA